MNRSILIAVATIALGTAAAAPAAATSEYGYRDRDERRYERERDYGRGRDYDRDRDYDRHHDRRHEERYVVHFHLDGGSREIRAKSHDRARRMVAFLRSVGADAHLDGYRTVHYDLRGDAEVVLHCDEDAHKLAEKLEGYGFHAHVDHE